jgi:hypothetical protein
MIIDPCIVSGESHSDNGVNWFKILVGEVLSVFLEEMVFLFVHWTKDHHQLVGLVPGACQGLGVLMLKYLVYEQVYLLYSILHKGWLIQ